MNKSVSMTAHPMVIFWLGLLTGAVIVSLIFLYKVLIPADFESSIFRNPRVPKNFDNNQSLQQEALPKIAPSPGINPDKKAFPTPTPSITF